MASDNAVRHKTGAVLCPATNRRHIQIVLIFRYEYCRFRSCSARHIFDFKHASLRPDSVKTAPEYREVHVMHTNVHNPLLDSLIASTLYSFNRIYAQNSDMQM